MIIQTTSSITRRLQSYMEINTTFLQGINIEAMVKMKTRGGLMKHPNKQPYFMNMVTTQKLPSLILS